MARLLENLSKDILAGFKLEVPRYGVAENPEAAARLAAELGGSVVLKALVPVGRRGKAGAVKWADTPEEAAHVCGELLGTCVHNYPVEKVLVEDKLNIVRELFVSLTIDPSQQKVVVLASTQGGVDIEETAREHPDLVVSYGFSPLQSLPDWRARQIWKEAGLTGKELVTAGVFLSKLYRVFCACDAYILEVNPLVFTGDQRLVAAAAVMAIDDAAIFRHPELAGKVEMGTERAWRPLTELEKLAVSVNEADPYRGTARYTEMPDGDIGFMCGGGGASLLLFDAIRRYGGRPANYSEFGGNPTADKVRGLAKVILSKPGIRGLIVAQNITNNTQVDLVAEGIVGALKELNIDPAVFPIVVREAGVNEERARQILAGAGVEYHGDDITLTEAARRIVEKVRASVSAQ